jgi:hypothetical protein
MTDDDNSAEHLAYFLDVTSSYKVLYHQPVINQMESTMNVWFVLHVNNAVYFLGLMQKIGKWCFKRSPTCITKNAAN